MRFLLSIGLLLLALFCVYGFLASGELSGDEAILWKSGYAIVGGLAVLGALVSALGRRQDL